MKKAKSFNGALELILMCDFENTNRISTTINCPDKFLTKTAVKKMESMVYSSCEWCEKFSNNKKTCPTYQDIIDYFDRIDWVDDIKK